MPPTLSNDTTFSVAAKTFRHFFFFLPHFFDVFPLYIHYIHFSISFRTASRTASG